MPTKVRFAPKADIRFTLRHVRFVPKADSCTAAIDAQRLLRFNTDRGFGFILPDDGGTDVFVHHDVEAAGMKTLVAGQVLVYNTTPARDGRLKAVNLRLV